VCDSLNNISNVAGIVDEGKTLQLCLLQTLIQGPFPTAHALAWVNVTCPRLRRRQAWNLEHRRFLSPVSLSKRKE
jgi:hypothetical protein